MNLNDVLKLYGVDPSESIKLVRHKDSRFDLENLYRRGHLFFYQEVQSRPVFAKCKNVLSFLVGETAEEARLVGFHAVDGLRTSSPNVWPKDFPYPEMSYGRFSYKMRARTELDPVLGRLVIRWGSGARSWHQKHKPEAAKEVLELRATGHLKSFKDFQDVCLTFGELEQIIKFPSAHRDWRTALSSAGGIYLILDGSGRQYIGSAIGQEGFWGRWASYVTTGHGGNRQLKDAIAENRFAHHAFQFSILEIFSKSLGAKEATKRENLYKRKLGSRAFGLNSN